MSIQSWIPMFDLSVFITTSHSVPQNFSSNWNWTWTISSTTNLSVQWELTPCVYMCCKYTCTFSQTCTPSFSQAHHTYTVCKRAGKHSTSWVHSHTMLCTLDNVLDVLSEKLWEPFSFLSSVPFSCLSDCQKEWIYLDSLHWEKLSVFTSRTIAAPLFYSPILPELINEAE